MMGTNVFTSSFFIDDSLLWYVIVVGNVCVPFQTVTGNPVTKIADIEINTMHVIIDCPIGRF